MTACRLAAIRSAVGGLSVALAGTVLAQARPSEPVGGPLGVELRTDRLDAPRTALLLSSYRASGRGRVPEGEVLLDSLLADRRPPTG